LSDQVDVDDGASSKIGCGDGSSLGRRADVGAELGEVAAGAQGLGGGWVGGS